jgi:oligopeptide/dipeptide ABC transporter ATP-binding protein
MRSGGVVETGTVDQVFNHPVEPYTQELLKAAPNPVPRSCRDLASLQGVSVDAAAT